jgi:hypothetical protein
MEFFKLMIQEEYQCLYLYIPPTHRLRKTIMESKGKIKDVSQNPGISIGWGSYQLGTREKPLQMGKCVLSGRK